MNISASSSKVPLSLLLLTAVLTSICFVRYAGGQDLYVRLVPIRERVNIRQNPSPSSPVLRVIKSDEELKQLEQKGNWYKVELPDGTIGWGHRTLFVEKGKAISAPTLAPTPSPTHGPSVSSVTPSAQNDLPSHVSTGDLKDHVDLFWQIKLHPYITIGFLASMGIIMVASASFCRRYLLQRQLEAFLYKILPCSMDRSLFPYRKSLFDILLDLGISLESITLISMSSGTLMREPLCWISVNGRLNHNELNISVKESVAFYGTYEMFVKAMKASLQAGHEVTIPEIVSQHKQTIQESIEIVGHRVRERLIEEHSIFESMICALRDETKTDLARRLGIIHRFDYVTSQLFRSVAESENRRIAASLDYKPSSNEEEGNPLIALGRLSAMAQASMWSIGMGSEFLSGLAEASALDIGFEAAGSEGGFDGLEDLGELVLIVGAILLTVQVFKTIATVGKFWRERHFRRYQAEFKRHMEGMTELFFQQGEEEALRVPRLVVQALAHEEERLEQLVSLLRRKPLSDDPDSNIGRLAFILAQRGHGLYSMMRQKLTGHIEDLLKSVCSYAKSGRHDMAGVHLYINKELAFLPSQLSEKQLTEIRTTLRLLLQEVDKLRKASKGK